MATILNSEYNIQLKNDGTNYYIVVPDEYKNYILEYNKNSADTFGNCNLLNYNADIEGIRFDCVQNAYTMFYYANKVTGNVFTDTLTDCRYSYLGGYNITGNLTYSPSVTNLRSTYSNCRLIKGNPVPVHEKTTNMSFAYANCWNITGNPICVDNVVSLQDAYQSCYNLTGSPVCGNNTTSLFNTYYNCRNLTGNPVCGNNVTLFNNTYYNCRKLTGSPVCGPNVNNMAYTYYYCYNLTGNPVCSPNVTNMAYTYYYCVNLTGAPICENNITNMYCTYQSCYNLTGNPVCGNNVTTMFYAYYNCRNLTGNPACGDNVTTMYYAYYNCRNLTGNPICGPNVTNMAYTYYYCVNLTGNMYWSYNNLSNKSAALVNIKNMFYGHDANKRINIFIAGNSAVNNALYNIGNTANGLTGTTFVWTLGTNNYYNTEKNIYVYYEDIFIKPNEIVLNNFNLATTATSYQIINTTTAASLGII